MQNLKCKFKLVIFISNIKHKVPQFLFIIEILNDFIFKMLSFKLFISHLKFDIKDFTNF